MTQRGPRFVMAFALLVSCSPSANDSALTTRDVPTTIGTTTTTRPPTTTRATTTTTRPTTTTAELALPEPANVEADSQEEYATTLTDALVAAYRLGCEQTVETIAFEVAAIFDHTYEWLQDFSAAEEAGSLDFFQLQEKTELLASKLLVFDLSMDELVELGGGQARYAALIGDTVGGISASLLIWATTGIDPHAGTYDLNQLEEFGFSASLADLQFRALDAEDDGLAARYCD